MIRPIRSVSLAAFFLTQVAAARLTLAAQAVPVLSAGSRVRVTFTTAPPTTVVGTLQRLGDDTLHVRVTRQRESLSRKLVSENCAIPLSAISTVEVTRGMHGRAARGAVYGVLIGATVGALAGVAGGDVLNMSAGDKALAGGVAFGAFGAGVGALIGAASRSEEWETVPITHVLRVGPVVTLDRVGVTASWRF
jgi:hypothetical protein